MLACPFCGRSSVVGQLALQELQLEALSTIKVRL